MRVLGILAALLLATPVLAKTTPPPRSSRMERQAPRSLGCPFKRPRVLSPDGPGSPPVDLPASRKPLKDRTYSPDGPGSPPVTERASR